MVIGVAPAREDEVNRGQDAGQSGAGLAGFESQRVLRATEGADDRGGGEIGEHLGDVLHDAGETFGEAEVVVQLSADLPELLGGLGGRLGQSAVAPDARRLRLW
jgi:hypothetical protein